MKELKIVCLWITTCVVVWSVLDFVLVEDVVGSSAGYYTLLVSSLGVLFGAWLGRVVK